MLKVDSILLLIRWVVMKFLPRGHLLQQFLHQHPPPRCGSRSDSKEGEWVSVSPMRKHERAYSHLFPDGEVLVVGGENEQGHLDTARVLAETLYRMDIYY